MATAGDVEMADADRSPAPPAIGDVLDAISIGNLKAIPSFSASAPSLQTEGDVAETDAERDLLAPFLPLLTRLQDAGRASGRSSSSSSALASILGRYDHVNVLSEYTAALQSLTPESLANKDTTEQADATPAYRQFESADASERACIVLRLVLAFADGSVAKDALHENELVRNEIYKPHLTAIFVNALAADALLSAVDPVRGVTLAKIVRFCLAVPVGVDLIEAIVLNDPSSVSQVVDLVVQSIRACNPLQPASSTSVVAPAGASSALSSSLLPFELRQAHATCSALAALSPSYVMQIMCRLRADSSSVAAAFVAFQLIVETPSLRGDGHFYSAFIYQWMKHCATEKTGSPSGLHVFLQASLTREGESALEQDKSSAGHAAAASFLEEARYVMSQFRQFLIEDIVQFRLAPSADAKAPSRFTLNAMLNVLVGLLVIGQLHPEDHETTQMLRLFDKTAKEIAQLQPQTSTTKYERMVSLMYVLVLLLCAPSAPAFAKMPSQREDSTKLVLQLAQQCVYSLYNTKATCPLFILSSVLLYTKSPALLSFLTSFLHDTFPMLATTVRVELLHGVGDAILKPILTENVMAREVLTAFEPVKHAAATNRDTMDEMALRSIHGLLTEKSFLRHHHGRKLEEWMATQLDRVAAPVHPLIVSVLLEWIENYVMAFEYPITQRPLLQLAVIPLSPAFVAKALNHSALTGPYSPANGREWARATLVLVYALQFNQRLRQGSAMPGTKLYAFANQGNEEPSDQPVLPPLRGSADICLAYDLDGFPLGNIASQVVRFASLKGAFEFAAPTLLRLLAEEHPQLLASDSAVVPRAPKFLSSVGVKHKLVLSFVDHLSSDDSVPRISWTKACMWLQDLSLTSPRRVEEALSSGVTSLVPLAILYEAQAGQEDDEDGDGVASPHAFLQAFADLYEGRSVRGLSDPGRLDKKLVEALCFPHLVWRHFQQTEERKATPSSTVSASSNHSHSWIRRDQLVEQPYFVLQNAYAGVLSSLPMLRLCLGLIQRFRDECIFQLRRRETLVALAKKAAQAVEASGGAAVIAVSSSDPATQQFLFLQDCILVQTLLKLVADARQLTRDENSDERVFLLYKTVDRLLADSKGASPPLALVVHNQGYDPSLVASFVANAPSLKQLWLHWMQQPSVEASAAHGKGPDSRRGIVTGSGSKAIADFVSDSATEKDLIKWQFRARVFFLLCERHFSAPAHNAVAVVTLKQILNRLRGIAVSSSGSSKGVLHAASIGDNTARIAFVEAVLGDAIDGCGRHAELRSEVAQFLLNLKKHVGTTGSHSAASSSPSGVDASVARTGNAARDRHLDLERVVFRAYERILHYV